MGFPRSRKLYGVDELPGLVSPEDWVSRVRHVVPEANAFEFVLFGDNGVVAEDENKVSSPIQSLGAGDTLVASAEEEAPHNTGEPNSKIPNAIHDSVRLCSAQGLENEAYLLLEGAKEPIPASTNVSGTIRV